ncbi:hypothetical protein AB0I77_37630 [Streptomyces sp. NPDC050619]|uniref:hypothetical protein n=1 Tax=Streptomyces sp. NPDC050619 TaxID=3157214 RepID=UPI0034270690
MNEWLSVLSAALIGAGSALAGSLITGRSTREAGERQAAAAEQTMRLTLDEQRAARIHAQRREAYVGFLQAVNAVLVTRRTGEAQPSDLPDLERAYSVVLLEGPAGPADAARSLMALLPRHPSLGELDAALGEFIEAARTASERGSAA